MISRHKEIRNITLIGAVTNILLSTLKILVGFIGRSSAMIADGIHSLSDLISDIIVLVFARISTKNHDRGHAFGHGKFETLATLIVAIILIVVGGSLMAGGIKKIIDAIHGTPLPQPSIIALWAAVISIIAKEILYQATLRVGRRINSPVVIANAWHHRSDAFSSIGAFIGIGGAILLGNKWVILDPIVSCVISVMIIIVAIKMAIPNLAELLESSLPEEIEQEIIRTALAVHGVRDIHELKTRRNGIAFIIDAHVVVDADISVVQAHDIATNVEVAIRKKFGPDTQLNIHIEPSSDAL